MQYRRHEVSPCKARKIGQGFDWLEDFPSERNNGVNFRARTVLQALNALPRARHTGATFSLAWNEGDHADRTA